MSLEQIPDHISQKYRFAEWQHATAILAADFPGELEDLLYCLESFTLKRSAILTPGGGRSLISREIDGLLHSRGWSERNFDISQVVDGESKSLPTHKIDNTKNRVGIEVEWNNKTEFYDRDLNNFRLLNERDVLSVGVIITRQSELQILFNKLGKGPSHGASTTHWNKIIPKINGGSAGGCPLLLVGLGMECYDANG